MTASNNRQSWNGSAKAVGFALAVVIVLGGCAHISIKKGPNDGGKGQTPPPPPTASDQSQGPSVTGDWQFGFQFNNVTKQSDVHLEQQGQTFQGSGKDSQGGSDFTIEGGQLTGTQVSFFKKYSSGNTPDIQYTGTLEMANDASYKGPYMHGEYQTAKNGQIMSNIWEAEMTQAGSTAQAPPPSHQQPTPQAILPAPGPSVNVSSTFLDKTPELSGKWNVAYEYNFAHVHSTMFLEQMGDRITGHGVDHQTKQKFVIEKGWYHFPRLTLIRKYPKQAVPKPKGKGTITLPERMMTFKCKVTNVNDKDYHGPYLKGETQGGGEWEAEMYR